MKQYLICRFPPRGNRFARRSYWRKKTKKRTKKFGGKTWTDIYEDLREVAMEEIKLAEEYRKKRKLRSLQNRVKMGFFKTPPPPPPKKKVKKAKGPKFLTKKLKEKERYDVLAELFEDVDLKVRSRGAKTI